MDRYRLSVWALDRARSACLDGRRRVRSDHRAGSSRENLGFDRFPGSSAWTTGLGALSRDGFRWQTHRGGRAELAVSGFRSTKASGKVSEYVPTERKFFGFKQSDGYVFRSPGWPTK